ncbi:carbohydrate ABC transporter permease [Clostridium sp. E02]|uniref:carbohydrate ABC transporter permease n=1 Tax=Clostridium sp. E02 TaxID=2487134 RepID=UPI000F5430C1|nr:carbohydrate ABC transporter permease [Clostridium sp. E02]
MKSESRSRQIGKDRIFTTVNYMLFGLFTVICIYPFYYLVINTISANDLSAAGEINLIPQGIHFENYKSLIVIRGLLRATIISFSKMIIGTGLTVAGSAFLGYMFTQDKMWKRKFWYRFVIITMYFNAGLIPMFLTMKNLHLTNTFWVYVIPTIVQPFSIILVKTYVESIPKELQEAAQIDGAGIIMIFLKIILPACTPILATVAIFAAVNQWNSYQDTLIYITDQKLYSLQYLLYTYINQANSLAAMVKNSSGTALSSTVMATRETGTSIRMTVSVMVVLPILCIYPMFQRFFVKGIMIGAVKG